MGGRSICHEDELDTNIMDLGRAMVAIRLWWINSVRLSVYVKKFYVSTDYHNQRIDADVSMH